jgi:MFS transporter, FHS family, L-fucose permease
MILELMVFQLLDVLNAHFQVVFGIDKTRSTLLQLAYFGAYLVFSPFAGIFVRHSFIRRNIFKLILLPR